MTGWTWDQVRDQLDLPRVAILRTSWNANPPLAITMRVAAEALGVRFNGGQLTGDSPAAASEPHGEFNPYGLMAELGQSEVASYKRPAMGLPRA